MGLTAATVGNQSGADQFDANRAIVEFWRAHAGTAVRRFAQWGLAGAAAPAAAVRAATASWVRGDPGGEPSASVT